MNRRYLLGTLPLLAAAPAASDPPRETTEWTSYLKDLGERRLKEGVGAVKTRLDEWGVLKAASTAMSLVSAVLLYSDLATDGVFMVSLFLTGNYIWGSLSAFFITLQFAASFAGVVLYVSRVADAKATAAVLVFGFPLAPLVLDLCLVLEPLGGVNFAHASGADEPEDAIIGKEITAIEHALQDILVQPEVTCKIIWRGRLDVDAVVIERGILCLFCRR